eukprot:6195246-Pleurochrysis_carterae.AAC.1
MRAFSLRPVMSQVVDGVTIDALDLYLQACTQQMALFSAALRPYQRHLFFCLTPRPFRSLPLCLLPPLLTCCLHGESDRDFARGLAQNEYITKLREDARGCSYAETRGAKG